MSRVAYGPDYLGEHHAALERSHPRNSSSLVAVSSYLTVVDAPQAVHLHRWDPDEVLPLRLVRPPRWGQ